MDRALASALLGLAIRASYTGPVEAQRAAAGERVGKRHARGRRATTTIRKKPARKIAHRD